MFRAEFCLVGCRTVKLWLFRAVSVIKTRCSGWPFDLDLERDVALVVFCFIVEGGFFLDVLQFLRVLMRLNIVGLEFPHVASFYYIWIVMSLKHLETAGLVFLRTDFGGLKVVMVSSFPGEFGVGRRAMMHP